MYQMKNNVCIQHLQSAAEVNSLALWLDVCTGHVLEECHSGFLMGFGRLFVA